jgi:hypothetical protein
MKFPVGDKPTNLLSPYRDFNDLSFGFSTILFAQRAILENKNKNICCKTGASENVSLPRIG